MMDAVRAYSDFLHAVPPGEGLPLISKVGGIWVYGNEPTHEDVSASYEGIRSSAFEFCAGVTISLVRRIVDRSWSATYRGPAPSDLRRKDQRDCALFLSRVLTASTYKDIGHEFSLKPATARMAVGRFVDKMDEHPWLRAQVLDLAQEIQAEAVS